MHNRPRGTAVALHIEASAYFCASSVIRITSVGDKAIAKCNLSSIPKMDQMFHVEHLEGHCIAACKILYLGRSTFR
jgi:hypothetical protein